jgi:hypothetical protein
VHSNLFHGWFARTLKKSSNHMEASAAADARANSGIHYLSNHGLLLLELRIYAAKCPFTLCANIHVNTFSLLFTHSE